jgi:hypothetical protein
MRIAELRADMERLQAILGLTEWKLRLVWGRPRADPDFMKGEIAADCEANCWWSVENSTALIAIWRGVKDPLLALKHELLHLRLEGHHAPEKKKYDAHYERAINAIASALAK